MYIVSVLKLIDHIEWYSAPLPLDELKLQPCLLKFPPLVVWRYKKQSEFVSDQIFSALSTFRGEIEWEFDISARNWVLCPKQIQTKNDVTRLASINPSFGKNANLELDLLSDHFHREILS